MAALPGEQTPPIRCPHCGQEHRTGAKFCTTTGLLIGQAEGAPSVQPPLPGAASLEAAPVQEATAAAASARGLTGKLPPNALLKSRYLIIQKIGQGGMGAVYQAADTQNPGVIRAVKEMSDAAIPNPADRAYAVESFLREAQLLQALDHPNLPKVVDVFSESGKQYLVMEFVHGQTLQAILESRSQPFTEAEVTPWAVQLCDVLAYLHAQKPQIIFRDLKPGNIMITPEGQVKLIDFGIVRFFKPGQSKDTMALGTPGYAAPEAIGGQTDERSDLFSLCVTLHQLLTLNDPARTMYNLPPVQRLNPKVSSTFAKVIERGVQNAREFRWPNALELQRSLRGIAPAVPAPAPTVDYVSRSADLGEPAPVTPHRSAPVLATVSTPQVPLAGVPGVGPASRSGRPTTRLLMVAVQLSPRQVFALGAGLLVALVLAAFLLTNALAQLAATLGIDLTNIPLIALFGALGYAAFPRRGVVFGAHTLFSLALVATIWSRAEGQDLWEFYGPVRLLLGAVISGIVMELWVFFLPRIKDRRGGAAWQRELIWLALMAVIGAIIFFAIVTALRYGFNPIMWVLAAIFGGLGWFVGDLVQQYLLYKRTGLWREH